MLFARGWRTLPKIEGFDRETLKAIAGAPPSKDFNRAEALATFLQKGSIHSGVTSLDSFLGTTRWSVLLLPEAVFVGPTHELFVVDARLSLGRSDLIVRRRELLMSGGKTARPWQFGERSNVFQEQP